MPEAFMRMTTSSGSGTGSGYSRISSLPSPRKTTALMPMLLVARGLDGAEHAVQTVAVAWLFHRRAPPPTTSTADIPTVRCTHGGTTLHPGIGQTRRCDGHGRRVR